METIKFIILTAVGFVSYILIDPYNFGNINEITQNRNRKIGVLILLVSILFYVYFIFMKSY